MLPKRATVLVGFLGMAVCCGAQRIGAEPAAGNYSFPKARTAYVLNLTSGGTDVSGGGAHRLVPFGQPMTFAGSIKHSKDSRLIVRNVRSHAETYADWHSIAALPVDFLRTGLYWNYGPGNSNGRGADPKASPHRFPDQPDKVIVGYVNLCEFTRINNWDPSFDPAWDTKGGGTIDPQSPGLTSYVDVRVFNAPWKSYVAAYWTDSWRQELRGKIDLAVTEHFDGVMLDVMTGYWTWMQAYPSMNLGLLRARLVDLLKWASLYAKGTYGTAFVITVNLDSEVHEYFPDLGSYVDAGYYQNAFFEWNGSGRVNGYCLPSTTDRFSNAAIDFIKSQGLAVLDMEHLGTGKVSTGLDFTNYEDRITPENLYKLFRWAIESGSTPFVTRVFMQEPYVGLPRFVRVRANLPSMSDSRYPDWVIGSDANDRIDTGSRDDVIYGGPGDDAIDGGAGSDTAWYSKASANYTVTRADGAVIVVDATGVEGTDRLVNIERLYFADGERQLDQMHEH
jgi:hypothetical protein